MNEAATHTAWRFLANGIAYVEWIGNGKQRGDRYSYTPDVDKAKKMTEAQCKAFCSYMRECAAVGYWS